MSKSDWLAITLDDLRTLAKASGYDFDVLPVGKKLTVEENPLGDRIVDGSGDLLERLARCAVTESPQAFCDMVDENFERLLRMAFFDDEVSCVIVEGFRLGISRKSGASACSLGALYYDGCFVEQDYQKAAELYELGADWGNIQAIVNLGYIFEYGRTGERDYVKAFSLYAAAAALSQSSEALYKMGDMFSRGKGIEPNRKFAAELWKRSMNKAPTSALKAQAAIRLAPLYLEGDSEVDLDRDPLYALKLYQDAEIGLREDIAKGLTYYEKRLEEALEGQRKAREAIEEITRM